MLVTDKVGAEFLIANTWYLSKAEVNLILPESTDLAARTKIIYVVSVLIWTLHKHSLSSNFLLTFFLFQNYKVKMSGDQEPHTNGLNGEASDEEVRDKSSEQSQNIARIGNWYFVNLSAANV